jgi:3-oxoacyl-[acyl-carrier protein] reductase
MDP